MAAETHIYPKSKQADAHKGKQRISKADRAPKTGRELDASHNRLLAVLPRDAYARIEPYCERMVLESGTRKSVV